MTQPTQPTGHVSNLGLPVITSRGRVRVNDGIRIIDTAECQVWNFDLRAKRAVCEMYAWLGDGVTVFLEADAQTLHQETDVPEGTPTALLFPFLDPDSPPASDGSDLCDWHVLAEVSRYTLTVCLYRRLPHQDGLHDAAHYVLFDPPPTPIEDAP